MRNCNPEKSHKVNMQIYEHLTEGAAVAHHK